MWLASGLHLHIALCPSLQQYLASPDPHLTCTVNTCTLTNLISSKHSSSVKRLRLAYPNPSLLSSQALLHSPQLSFLPDTKSTVFENLSTNLDCLAWWHTSFFLQSLALCNGTPFSSPGEILLLNTASVRQPYLDNDLHRSV